MSDLPLSVLIWLPLASVLLGALAGRRAAPRVALVGALATLVLAVLLVADFETGARGQQHVTDINWISELGIHYKLGLDGLNLSLVVLTALLWAASVAAANLRGWERPQLFFFHLGLAESAVLGALLAQDLALFVVFFDLMLIPFYFLIGSWGTGERVRATTKLVIYTLVGSLLMLAAAIAAGVLATPDGGSLSFVLSDLRARVGELSATEQNLIFLGFAAAFLVKMPAFPFHGWLPDGYRAMPIPVVAVFSGVLSKVAAYGFLRIVLPIFPDASAHFQTLILLIALASILYGSVMAFSQRNVRLVVAYSSIAQLGFITLGIFSLRPEGAQGALLQMVNHGLVTAPLFFIIALLAARAGGSEDMRAMGGVARGAPVLAALFLVVSLATLAMPGSANFVGEFLILLGVFQTKLVFAFVAATGVALAAVYMLRAFIGAMHNQVGRQVIPGDLRVADGLVIVPLVVAIVALALYPQLPLERSERPVTESVRAAQRMADPAAREVAGDSLSQSAPLPPQGAGAGAPGAGAGVPPSGGSPPVPGAGAPPSGGAPPVPAPAGGGAP